MKQRDHFTFLRSYYEMFKHLKTKKDQALFINSILSSQFLCKKIEVLPEFSPSLQMALEAVSYQVNSSIDGYIKQNGDLTPKHTPQPTPKKEKKKENIPKGIEIEIWKEWETYRRELKKTLTPSTRKRQLNFLLKRLPNHKRIIEQSIENGWTGLFEIKTQTAFKGKEPQVGSLEWKRQQQLKQQEETIDAELIQTS